MFQYQRLFAVDCYVVYFRFKVTKLELKNMMSGWQNTAPSADGSDGRYGWSASRKCYAINRKYCHIHFYYIFYYYSLNKVISNVYYI